MTLRKPANVGPLVDEIPVTNTQAEEVISLLKIIIEHLAIITDETIDTDDVE